MKKFLILAAAILFFGCSSEDSPEPAPNPSKDDPVAKDDSMSATENEELTFETDLLLENDTRIDNARISDFDSETTKGGEVRDNRDGTWTYTPPEDFKGEDNFTYDLCVPGSSDRCSTATVKINVMDAGSPVATDDSYETTENDSYEINNYLDNDDLVDGASLSDFNTDGTKGTVEKKENGSFVYTAPNGFAGEDSFTYTICDDDETPNCSTATIRINVKDEGSPLANDDTYVIETNSANVVLDRVLDNDDLIDDAVITSVDDENSSGTATLNNDGTITYSTSSGFTGEDSFTYTICDDDSTCSTAKVTITVVEPVSFNIPGNLSDYYSDATFSIDPDLLYNELSSFTTTQHVNRLEYYERHDYLYDADEDPDNPANVILMYSGESRPEDEYWEGNTRDEWETFNTEHIYPQSRLSSEEAKNDMHHMRAADIDVNEMRSNYPYTGGSGEYKLVDGNKWYPGDDWRGDVARMVMYVNLRYGEDFETVGSLQLFLEWNVADPVSAFEIHRNNVIEAAQGNRNPFIDNPYLATMIWGGEAAENRWE